jgi:hypothetical protein
MGLLSFIDPIAAQVFGHGGSKPPAPKPYIQPNPVPVHLTLPQANPDWNTATVKIPTASQHGWSGNSLQSYLQTFQRGGGPAPGDWNKMPNVQTPSVMPSSGPADLIQSLVKNSVGGEMSPAAAALYGRMLGATPPPAVAATSTTTAPRAGGGTAPLLAPGMQAGSVNGKANPNAAIYNNAFKAGQNSLYKGMTPLQRSQANAVYNVTQPVSPTLQ